MNEELSPPVPVIDRGSIEAWLAHQRRLEHWLASETANHVRAVVRRVESWVYPNGSCLTPGARLHLSTEAESAVGETNAEVLRKGTFVHSRPVQVRIYVVKSAAGKVIRQLRREWPELPLDEEVAAETPDESGEAPGVWLTGLARGRPARPLVHALIEFSRGTELEELATGVRSLGLELSDEEVAVELLRALRFARRGNRSLAGLLDEARARLDPHVRRYFDDRGLDGREVAVVVDQLFGVPAATTGARLGVSGERVRNLRREAKDRYELVRESFDTTMAMGWPLA